MANSRITVRLAERGDVASLLDVLPQITSRPDSLAATTLDLDASTRIFDQMFVAETSSWSLHKRNTRKILLVHLQ